MVPQIPRSTDDDNVLRALGRLEGRVDLLISNHLPHLHADVMANRRLTQWVGTLLGSLLLAMSGLLVRLLIG
jgi:hypothetical protein